MGPRFNGVEDRGYGGGGLGDRGASMGPRFNGVEDESKVPYPANYDHASMGPRFNGVEDTEHTCSDEPRSDCFNGATL